MKGNHHGPAELRILVDAVTPGLVVEDESVSEKDAFDFPRLETPKAAHATVTSSILWPWFPDIRSTFLGASK